MTILVILVWKIFISIEGNQKIWEIFVIGRCRNILVELSKNLLQVADSDHWRILSVTQKAGYRTQTDLCYLELHYFK